MTLIVLSATARLPHALNASPPSFYLLSLIPVSPPVQMASTRMKHLVSNAMTVVQLVQDSTPSSVFHVLLANFFRTALVWQPVHLGFTHRTLITVYVRFFSNSDCH